GRLPQRSCRNTDFLCRDLTLNRILAGSKNFWFKSAPNGWPNIQKRNVQRRTKKTYNSNCRPRVLATRSWTWTVRPHSPIRPLIIKDRRDGRARQCSRLSKLVLSKQFLPTSRAAAKTRYSAGC